jgi:hypothetical protein
LRGGGPAVAGCRIAPVAASCTVVWLLTVPPLMATVRGPELQGEDPVLTAIWLPLLPPELMASRSIMPPLALAVAGPALPAAALPPLPPAPPAPPVAVLLLPPLALAVAVPPSALRRTVVWLLTWPPLTAMLAG